MSGERDALKSAAQLAFEAYSADTGGKTWDGKLIPPWEALPPAVQRAWTAAALEVARSLSRV